MTVLQGLWHSLVAVLVHHITATLVFFDAIADVNCMLPCKLVQKSTKASSLSEVWFNTGENVQKMKRRPAWICGTVLCDVGVQSAAVNVICELARKNPKNYLSLAPLFFKLMTSSTNNWVLIKIIKLVLYYRSPCCITIVRDMIVSLSTFMNPSCSVVVGVGYSNKMGVVSSHK